MQTAVLTVSGWTSGRDVVRAFFRSSESGQGRASRNWSFSESKEKTQFNILVNFNSCCFFYVPNNYVLVPNNRQRGYESYDWTNLLDGLNLSKSGKISGYFFVSSEMSRPRAIFSAKMSILLMKSRTDTYFRNRLFQTWSKFSSASRSLFFVGSSRRV